MGALDIAALVVIFILIVAITAVIVVLGTLPGDVARKRGHPYPDAVGAASWIGIATGVFWPIAFIWAFLPVPARPGAAAADSADRTELEDLRRRVAAFEEAAAKSGSQPTAGGAP